MVRAFSTCKASSTSTSPRRAATAASPTSGSWLLVAAATWVTSLEAASPMASIYFDSLLTSTAVDRSFVLCRHRMDRPRFEELLWQMIWTQ